MDDESPLVDITNFRTFVVVAVLMIFFGVMVGIGMYITFSGLHITLTQGIAIITVIFVTCGITAYIPYLYRDWRLGQGMFAPEESDEDDEP